MSLAVFFRPEMVADSASFSPSAAKPAKVVATWQSLGLPMTIHEPDPVREEQLALAHERRFVEDILAGRAANGFGNRSPEVARSLRYTSGAMLSGARSALRERTFACAPCSGFHHAGYATAAGFCTFNGLVVAACALREEGLANRVGILDCDHHYGDGTDEILARIDARGWIDHYTAGREYGRPNEAEPFLARLPTIVRAMTECDVVLYQAGADPHIDDPLGGWLTTEQLRRRDGIVFDELAAAGVPCVWNLAGGYQVERDGSIPRVIEIHTNTAKECIRAIRNVGQTNIGQTRATQNVRNE